MVRRVLVSLAVVVGLVGFVSVTPAEAKPACGVVQSCVYEYFDTPDYWHMVGWKTIECNGEYDQWGVETQYVQSWIYPC